MGRKIDDWKTTGRSPALDRTTAAYAEMARSTKLRTLQDMTESEIRALEAHYQCRVVRPKGRRRAVT